MTQKQNILEIKIIKYETVYIFLIWELRCTNYYLLVITYANL